MEATVVGRISYCRRTERKSTDMVGSDKGSGERFVSTAVAGAKLILKGLRSRAHAWHGTTQRARTHTHTHTHTRTHARTRAHARTHTHTHIYDLLT